MPHLINFAATQAEPGVWDWYADFDEVFWNVNGEAATAGEAWEAIVTAEELAGLDANARLIAAAPDLLAVCLQAKDYLVRDLVEPGRTVFWNLVAAINKAQGRAS